MNGTASITDDFLRQHDYPCWCGERSASIFCRQNFGRRPFAVLKCNSCQTQRILPRVLATQAGADELYNSDLDPEPDEQQIQAGVARCLQRFANTGLVIKPGDRVLDVGCGSGHLLETLCSRFGCVGHGIDASAKRVAKAKASARHATFEKGLFDPKIFPGPFDVVLSTAVIEHVVDPVDFVTQLARVVKPGGSVYLLTPNSGSLNYFILRSWWRELLAIGEHIYLFTPESLTRCADRAGLGLVGVTTDFDLSRPAWGFTSLRKLAITVWSAHCEACKRICRRLAGARQGDILSAHFRKRPY